MIAYRLDVIGEWAGTTGVWRPAVAGTLNQTDSSDEHASVFRTREEAESFMNDFCIGQEQGDPRNFRIICIDAPWLDQDAAELSE